MLLDVLTVFNAIDQLIVQIVYLVIVVQIVMIYNAVLNKQINHL